MKLIITVKNVVDKEHMIKYITKAITRTIRIDIGLSKEDVEVKIVGGEASKPS